MSKKLVAYLQLHLAVILFGLTAILGDLISISALSLVWWRVLITSVSLLFFIQFGMTLKKLPLSLILKYSGIGILVAIHWLTFYGGIKFSNASVVLAAMATTSLFTSIVEPIITGKKFMLLEVVLGLLIIPPMLLIASNLEFGMLLGLGTALLSAFLASIFACFNKKLVHLASPFEISFLEMTSAFLFLSILLPFFVGGEYGFMPDKSDWIYLLILALACTTLAYVISINALKEVSAFDANLVINMEPVYGIFLAIIILKEHKEMTGTFYWGMIFIMLIVFALPFINKKVYGQ
ncbi:MAG: DMT family transporter [Saprospiraceae bacterium]|nr:DMT family transporter [Saprospiraceae bacterium]